MYTTYEKIAKLQRIQNLHPTAGETVRDPFVSELNDVTIQLLPEEKVIDPNLSVLATSD